MVSIKNELIKEVNEIITYPVLSVYPKDRIVPVCIMQETSNLSIRYRPDSSQVVYRFSLYSKNLTELKAEYKLLDDYMLGLGFDRSNYIENDSEIIHSITVSYEAIVRLEGDVYKIYRI